MIMTNTKQCRTCIYGEKWSGVYTCGRAFEKDGTINQGRIPTRTENKCLGYIKKGTRKMNAIIVEKKEETTAAPVVENAVDTVEKSDEKPKKRKWTDEDIQTLIHFYNKGTKVVVLADMFGVTKSNISNKIYELKQSEKWKGHFINSTIIPKTETLPEPETVTATLEKTKKTKFSIRDLKVACYDFISNRRKFDGEKEIHEKTNVVMDFINYIEKQVNENE